jgi:hypothetical protein
MNLLAAVLPLVLPHVPGAPDPTIESAARSAAREFFRQTFAWQEWLDPVSTVAGGNKEYDFELPNDADIARFERATIDGQPIEIGLWRQAKADPALFDGGVERQIVSGDLLILRLLGEFDAGLQLQAMVSLMPKLTATTVPDHLAGRYAEALADGALARLLNLGTASFFNRVAAGDAALRFQRAIDQCGTDLFRSHTNVTPRSRVAWC